MISPRAKGFSAILWHERSPPPGGESSSGGPERGSPDGRGKERGWWAKAADDESAKDEVDGNTSRTGSTPVGIRVENAELKLESRRLGNALCAAKVTLDYYYCCCFARKQSRVCCPDPRKKT